MDARLGEPKYVYGDPEEHFMDVPPEILKCVAFVAYRDKNGEEHIAGTCFFVTRLSDRADFRFGYVITARHVIDSIREVGYEPLLRLNLSRSGATLLPFSSPWVFHSDPDVDVAVAYQPNQIGLEEKDDHLSLPWAVIKPGLVNGVDPRNFTAGEDVFIAGCFYQHRGRGRNIPVVRLGSIAALPEERVEAKVGSPRSPRVALVEAYLIETRSQNGLSGSPVFVVETREANVHGMIGDDQLLTHRSRRKIFLLGIMKGHFDTKIAAHELPEGPARVNVGMSIAVPYYRILDVFRQPEITQYEADLLASHEREISATMDANGSGKKESEPQNTPRRSNESAAGMDEKLGHMGNSGLNTMEELPGSLGPLARRIIDDPTARSGRSVQFVPQEIARAEIRHFNPQFPFDQLIEQYDGRANFIVWPNFIVATAEVSDDGSLPPR